MDHLIAAGVALITGSGSGIGQQIAVTFAERGCKNIFLVDISEEGLQRTKELIASTERSAKVVIHVGDLTDDTIVKGMVDACIQQFGRIDFACNNAGMAMPNMVTTDIAMEAFDQLFEVNFKSIYLCHRYEIAAMLKQEPLETSERPKPNFCRGSIVNTASLAGVSAASTLPAYNATKHGIVSMTRVDARQFAAQGIRVNCVCPGFVDTPMFQGSGLKEGWMEAAKSQAPMNRFTEAYEVADGVLFLSGAFASAITGVSLPIDSGALLFHIV